MDQRQTEIGFEPALTPEASAKKANEEARREEYRRQLAEKLKDPEFRKVEGFPIGTDEAILAMSDPPYYTACPNPYLEEWIRENAKPYDPAMDDYHREPFAADVSEGKTDPIYTAHSYHTKVPHKAIMRYILHYTEPGDVIYDGFCGTGMTGVAAQMCGDQNQVQALGYTVKPDGTIIDSAGSEVSRLGRRKAVLNDLSPVATFIAYNYNTPVDTAAFAKEAKRILAEVDAEIGWMYETVDERGRQARLNYTVWSDVFSCPTCSAEINFVEEALDEKTKRVKDTFACPRCRTEMTKKDAEKACETVYDPFIRESVRRPKRQPTFINFTGPDGESERPLTPGDFDVLDRVSRSSFYGPFPTDKLPYMHMTHERARMDAAGITHYHHFYTPRALRALAMLWGKTETVADPRLRQFILFAFEQTVWGLSLLNRYGPTHFSQVNRYLSGVYYVASMSAEVSPRYILDGKVRRLKQAFSDFRAHTGSVLINTGSCDRTALPDNCLDYIFTDPPFGENIYYADLNYLIESWHGVLTQAAPEAIVDRAKKKRLVDYQQRMTDCFTRYYAALKPGRWMTVEFHNSANAVWNAIQEGLQTVGFVVADVRVLSKEQASYRQVTATSAVKQDLVISCYKPRAEFEERFRQVQGQPEGVVEFVRQHLAMLPVVPLDSSGRIEALAERGRYLLFDRMVAYHLQHGARIPMSSAEFYALLEGEFVPRDEMYFLPEQAAKYDAVRVRKELQPLSLFVKDERSAVQWVRAQLAHKPRTLGELTPEFLKQVQAIESYESLPELSVLLRDNFIEDKVTGRWRVPDPEDEKDLEVVRRKALLRMFDEYAKGRGPLKTFRKEAVLEGLKYCWQSRQFSTIVYVCERIPEKVLQEVHEFVQFYDIARDRVPEVPIQPSFTWE